MVRGAEAAPAPQAWLLETPHTQNLTAVQPNGCAPAFAPGPALSGVDCCGGVQAEMSTDSFRLQGTAASVPPHLPSAASTPAVAITSSSLGIMAMERRFDKGENRRQGKHAYSRARSEAQEQ